MSPSQEMVGGVHGVLGATAASIVALGCNSARENAIHQCKLILSKDNEMHGMHLFYYS